MDQRLKDILDEMNAMTKHNIGSEEAHVKADRLMQEALRHVGLSEIADAFDAAHGRIRFWYS